jgi:hypothetical protein
MAGKKDEVPPTVDLGHGVRYGLGTMTNDIEVSDKLLNATDYKTLNILGIFHNVSTKL